MALRIDMDEHCVAFGIDERCMWGSRYLARDRSERGMLQASRL